ncbi:hypothetical protein HOY80DRAFT_1028740 [Tuber brumale]|nr:hypothetical protein HOY80DRAFT_1028740 [Tuber brumale]
MSELSCGMDRLLVHQEYEAIECALLQIELKKWKDVDPKTGITAKGLNLNFKIVSQPGSGVHLEKSKAPTPVQIAMLYTIFISLGPIARTCLESISMMNVGDYNTSVDDYLSKVDLEIDTFITHGGFQLEEHCVHRNALYKMSIMEPSDNWHPYCARITSRCIAYRVYEKRQMMSQLRYFELYSHLASQGQF